MFFLKYCSILIQELFGFFQKVFLLLLYLLLLVECSYSYMLASGIKSWSIFIDHKNITNIDIDLSHTKGHLYKKDEFTYHDGGTSENYDFSVTINKIYQIPLKYYYITDDTPYHSNSQNIDIDGDKIPYGAKYIHGDDYDTLIFKNGSWFRLDGGGKDDGHQFVYFHFHTGEVTIYGLGFQPSIVGIPQGTNNSLTVAPGDYTVTDNATSSKCVISSDPNAKTDGDNIFWQPTISCTGNLGYVFRYLPAKSTSNPEDYAKYMLILGYVGDSNKMAIPWISQGTTSIY
ncbi:hypothetical protein [Cysteiniphilum sp. JM-1]|uniref:hypothetical protein n=1 Tax=Cysteiniphilum sp. JM-1 TaxID=2610891 RepID=UPI001244FC54|nr:hypothetical protein [Cysteiniphilum sp. JM-1]